MKRFSILLFLVLCFTLGCKQQASPESPEKAPNEIYKGPIIDMHLHAYGEGYGMFGVTHPPTLRNQTYQGSASAEEINEHKKVNKE